MVRHPILALRCLPFLLPFLACAAAGGGGSGGSGGGTGGSAPGSGGSGPALPDFLSHGPYPFPQSKTSGSCTLTTNASAVSATQSAYSSWKSSFVTSSGAPSGAMRVQDPTMNANCNGTSVTNRTVSEGMGYGMLAAVYMNDQPTFDGMLAYVNAHLDANGLMNWCISSSGTTVGSGSASDADEDMAFALLMAAAQWSSVDYYQAGTAMVAAMYGHSLGGDGAIYPGDTGGAMGLLYPDYFSPAYYRVFAKVGSANWGSTVISKGYSVLATVSGNDGLVPNNTNNNMLTPVTGTYGYDSCRTPWRIAMDYCFNGTAEAKTYLDKIGPFFTSIGAANIGDGYNVSTGAVTSSNHNMAFIGPAGAAGMAGYQTLLDGAFTFGVAGAGDNAYFTNSLRAVTMLMMSGNLLDYSQR